MSERICNLDGCLKPHSTHGFCRSHSRSWKLYGDPGHVEKPGCRSRAEVCAVDDCSQRPVGQGLCDMHYRRMRRYGDPLFTKQIKGDDEARFWSKVNKDGPVSDHAPTLGPCWLWTEPLGEGYGHFVVDGKILPAHRWAYIHFVEAIPPGMEPDHLCRVRACVNFESHLEPVTRRENVRRGLSFKFPDDLVAQLYERCLAGEPKVA